MLSVLGSALAGIGGVVVFLFLRFIVMIKGINGIFEIALLIIGSIIELGLIGFLLDSMADLSANIRIALNAKKKNK